MKQPIRLLSLLLIAQLALILLLWSQGIATGRGDAVSLIPEPSQITGLILEDPEEGKLQLYQSGDGWQFMDADDEDAERVDQARVERLINRLTELSPDFPVARSDEARERFRVAEDDFRRKLTLTRNSGEETVLLVGTSPVMGESYLRLSEDAAIYRVELPVYELSVNRDVWSKSEDAEVETQKP